jgi:hypothetical protein
MDGTHFDRLTRRFSAAPTRRTVLIGLAAALGLAVSPAAGGAKKRQRRKKKLKLNRFGCVDVGKPCRGNSANCCSGICEGRKPKKGKRDKSRCVAHNVGACTPENDTCLVETGNFCNPEKKFAACYRTTGNASFCGNAAVGGCIECRTDADCLDFGAGSACVVCPTCAVYGLETSCISPATA